MTAEYAKVTFYLGVLVSLTGAASFLLSAPPAPWPHAFILTGLLLINVGLFAMDRTVARERAL